MIPAILTPVGRQTPVPTPIIRQPLLDLHPGGATDAQGGAPADPIAAQLVTWTED